MKWGETTFRRYCRPSTGAAAITVLPMRAAPSCNRPKPIDLPNSALKQVEVMWPRPTPWIASSSKNKMLPLVGGWSASMASSPTKVGRLVRVRLGLWLSAWPQKGLSVLAILPMPTSPRVVRPSSSEPTTWPFSMRKLAKASSP